MDNVAILRACKQYYDHNEFHAKYFTSEPTGKPPIRYCGVSVLINGFDKDDCRFHDMDDEKNESERADTIYKFRIMPSGTPILEIMTIDYSTMFPDDSGEPTTHTKVRIIKNLDDIWSAAPVGGAGGEMYRLTRVMKKVGELIDGDETLFFKTLEEEPEVPF